LQIVDQTDIVKGVGDGNAILPIDFLFYFETPKAILECLVPVSLTLVYISDVIEGVSNVDVLFFLSLDPLLNLKALEIVLDRFLIVALQVIGISDIAEDVGGVDALIPCDLLINFKAHRVVFDGLLVISILILFFSFFLIDPRFQ
jgi:hypothetical protein